MGMVIAGVPVEKDDVFVVVNEEGQGLRRPNDRCNPHARRKIEAYFEYYNSDWNCGIDQNRRCYRYSAGCCCKAKEIYLKDQTASLNVIFEAKDMPHLLDNFGGLWTEGAQYKISRVKKWYPNRYTHALAYRGELMDALIHVNRYLGGHISFISDDFESFVGPHVGAAGTDEKRLTGHSGRCFIVGLAEFSS